MRLVRVLLVVIGIAIASTAAYYLKDLDTRLTTQRASTEALREQAAALTATIADLRAGQFAYVARGQGEAFWMSHVASLLTPMQKQTVDFEGMLTAPSAVSAFEPVTAALENFKTLDTRVKEMVQSGNQLLAADLIFSDGLESTAAASSHVATALNEELRVRTAATAAVRNQPDRDARRRSRGNFAPDGGARPHGRLGAENR